MATETSKARARAVAKTLEAAERMAGKIDSTGSKGGEVSSAHPSLPARCPECGKVAKKNCCWYSRSVRTAPAQELKQ